MKKEPGILHTHLLPRAAKALILALRATMRFRFEGAERMDALIRARRPFVLAFWHEHLMMMRYAFRGRPEGVAAVIGRHRDAEIISRTMNLFGHLTVRGSSRDGALAALREAARTLRAGVVVAFTPDGPRGPRRVAQAGAVQAARLAEVPILPVAFAASKKNACLRGIGSWFPILFREGCLCTAT